ncbi:FxsA family protein [Pilimelia columellifera]|uniref:FxsA family protein n=1 Tax=Pilimelia columellifera subsp. columellifera TaxID=706583 RepID=A0ABN3NQC5_9ACTN
MGKLRRYLLAGTGATAGWVAVEAAALWACAQVLGWPWTVALLVALSATGLVLLRRGGAAMWRAARAGTAAPADLVAVAAALLVAIPGLITAVVGLVMWLPPTRVLLGALARERGPAAVRRAFGPRRVRADGARPPGPAGEAIDGEIV